MSNYSDEGNIALVCNNSACANVVYTDIVVNISMPKDVDIIGFESKIECKCPKCNKGIMTEVNTQMASIISKLIKKHYYVLDHNQGDWAPGTLYAPFIKILIGGPMEKLERPKGWRDITPDSIGSFQIFAPIGSYGCATSDEDAASYAVEAKFNTEEDFIKSRDIYLSKLDKWVDRLELNTTIATKQNLSAGSDIVDIN